MDAAERRNEIKNILIVRRRTTARELAEELGVTMRTIQNDIVALTPGFPLDTKPGGGGGIFLRDDYKPYNNTLSSFEIEVLIDLYNEADGVRKEVLYSVLKKYGPSKLKL